MKIVTLVLFATLVSNFALAEIKDMQCDSVFGNSVYEEFILKSDFIEDEYGMPYDLLEFIGTEVTLIGKSNPKHEDVMENDEGWNYVTLGPRKSKIKKADEYGVYFYIEPCEHCDFNSAIYKYQRSNDNEMFITEMYGSDGSGEFSVYSCFLVPKTEDKTN